MFIKYNMFNISYIFLFIKFVAINFQTNENYVFTFNTITITSIDTSEL